MMAVSGQNGGSKSAVGGKVYSSGGAVIVDIAVIVILTGVVMMFMGPTGLLAGLFVSLVLVLVLSVRVINEWNRMPVLRLGNYVGIIGPGFKLITPIIESTPFTLDLRVISTAFNAEKTLTKDNVPVDVDAILFWQVHDPEKSILNVQDYYGSVLLASQTAMRDVIGKKELSMMLAGRDLIGEGIQKLIEERIKQWGIDAISVEIRDVKIPQELQNAMARVATSDREKQSRVILAESESLAADKMIEAAQKYRKDPYAMQLRALNMMYEISIGGKNVMVFVPTESRGFSVPTPIGVMGIRDMLNKRNRGNQSSSGKRKAE